MRKALSLVLGLLATTGYLALTEPNIGVPRLKVQAPTEASVKSAYKEEVRVAKLKKQYARATAIAAQAFHAAHRDGCRIYSDIVGRAAVDFNISPKLVVGTMLVESGCHSDAVSTRKSVGLMQLNCAVWKCDMLEMLQPDRNVMLGVKVLAGYVHRFGVVEGLHHYNGLGNSTNEYAASVLHAAGMLPKSHPIIPPPVKNNLTPPELFGSLIT